MNMIVVKMMTVFVMAISVLQGTVVFAANDFVSRLPVIGLTRHNDLVVFTTRRPDRVFPLGGVYGLTSGDTYLVGIDFRPQDGLLYGLGNKGGLYRFDGLFQGDTTATFIKKIADAYGARIHLRGKSFGLDFSPPANALRVVSNTGQNLAISVDPNTADVVAGRLSPRRGVSAIGYINNDNSPLTGSVLYDINTNTDQLFVQAPPNNGTLTLAGSLRTNAVGNAGFDIYSKTRNGVAISNEAFLVLYVKGRREFYTTHLTTGKVKSLGTLNAPVVDIALPLQSTVADWHLNN